MAPFTAPEITLSAPTNGHGPQLGPCPHSRSCLQPQVFQLEMLTSRCSNTKDWWFRHLSCLRKSAVKAMKDKEWVVVSSFLVVERTRETEIL